MPVKLLEGIVLVVSAILVIAGTATLWDARKAMTDEGILADTDEVRSRFNWDLIIFWLVWLAAAAALFIPKSFIFSSLAAGMGFVLSLQRNSAGTSPTGHASWGSINTCRIYEGSSTTEASWNRKCSSGGILAYVGLLLAIVLAFFSQGNMLKAEKTFDGKDKLLVIASALFAVVGSVVLWSSSAAAVPKTADFVLYGLTIDTTVETILATLYVVGATFNGNAALRASAGFVSAAVFVLIFRDMFNVVGLVGSSDKDRDQAYAGFLLCWFAMIVNLVVVTLQHWQNV